MTRDSNRRHTENESSTSFDHELTFAALRGKNIELAKMNSRILQDNSDANSKIRKLESELLEMEYKYNKLVRVITALSETTKRSAPFLIDLLNAILQIPNFSANSSVENITKQSLIANPSRVVMQPVKPHTVNGTVIRNPKISLTRLIDTSNEPNSSHVNLSNENKDLSNSATNLGERNEQHDNVNDSSDENEQSDEDDAMEEVPDNSRLSTIDEENYNTSEESLPREEVRIHLSRLPDDICNKTYHDKNDSSFRDSTCSTVPQVNDTCVNIETTMIETQENCCSKRLQVDVMVFSPHTNSTRLEESFIENTLGNSSFSSKRRCLASSTHSGASSTTNSSCLDPDTSRRLATTSVSALGDRTNLQGSQVYMLSQLELQHTSDRSRLDDSRPPFNSTPSRSTTSSFSLNNSCRFGDSPRFKSSSRQASYVTKRRGGSIRCSPVVMLEKFDEVMPNLKSAQARKNSENTNSLESAKTKGKPRANKRKKTPSPVKEEMVLDKHEESLEEKITELQRRLSDYKPESPGLPATPESPKSKPSPKRKLSPRKRLSDYKPEPSERKPSPKKKPSPRKRPTRAARPTVLKDASLKRKLRRN